MKREEAIRRALVMVPDPFDILEREAGLPERVLEQIRDGITLASPELTEKLAAAMERLGGRYLAAAAILRGSILTKGVGTYSI